MHQSFITLHKHHSRIYVNLLVIAICCYSFESFCQEPSRDELIQKRVELQKSFVTLYDEERYQPGVLIATEILSLTEELFGIDSTKLIPPLNNLASAYFMIGEYEKATETFFRCVELIENTQNILTPELIQPLNGIGLSLNQTEQYTQAVEVFKRALHINYVNDGFYNLDQINIHDSLTESFIGLEDFDGANHHQEFQVRIYKNHYGTENKEVDTSLQKLADWYKRSGQIFSERLIYEEIYKRQSNRQNQTIKDLVNTLKNLSFSHRREGLDIYDSVSPLKKALQRLEDDPDNHFRLKLEVLLDLGDTYFSYGKVQSGIQAYQECWGLIEEDSSLKTEIENRFSEPVKVRNIRIPRIYSPGDEPLENGYYKQGYISIRFDIDTRGRARNIKIIESDPDGLLDKEAELAIKRSVYRPVHIEGEIQPSKDLITRHEFQYYAEEQAISEPEILDQPLENPMT